MSNNKYIERSNTTRFSLKTFITSTRFLTLGLWLVGAFIILGGFSIGNIIYREYTPDWYVTLVMAIGIPWLLAGCLFVVIRREIPRLGLPSITGKFAIIQGGLCAIVLMIIEIYIVYLLLINT